MYEIIVKNLQRCADRTVQVSERVYAPNGYHETEVQRDWFIPSKYDRYNYSWGRGYQERGRWKLGTYRIVILINGVVFAGESFTLV